MLPRLLAVLVGVALLLAVVNALYSLVSGDDSGGGQVRQALQLVVLSGAWLLVNSPVEGRILLDVVPRHGVTQADIAVLPALLLAALIAVLQLRG